MTWQPLLFHFQKSSEKSSSPKKEADVTRQVDQKVLENLQRDIKPPPFAPNPDGEEPDTRYCTVHSDYFSDFFLFISVSFCSVANLTKTFEVFYKSKAL